MATWQAAQKGQGAGGKQWRIPRRDSHLQADKAMSAARPKRTAGRPGMAQQDQNEVLATVTVSATRRWLALSMLGGLGVLLIYFAFATPPANFALQAFVIVLGGLSLALMMKMHAGTSGQIDLTRAGLRDSDGTLIAPIEAIQAVERGAFAFKPSNGFLVRLDLNATEEDLPRVWRPGLWWRLGRRIGVGGVTPGNQTKIMAELLQALIVERG